MKNFSSLTIQRLIILNFWSPWRFKFFFLKKYFLVFSTRINVQMVIIWWRENISEKRIQYDTKVGDRCPAESDLYSYSRDDIYMRWRAFGDEKEFRRELISNKPEKVGSKLVWPQRTNLTWPWNDLRWTLTLDWYWCSLHW